MSKYCIEKLIPQRSPILMVDELLEADGEEATTCFTIRPDNLFIGVDELLEETGLIEHVAQSASALAGYKAVLAGAERPPVGYIGEIKHFHCYRRPHLGDKLCTIVRLGMEVNGVTLVTGESHIDGEVVANTQMKIFVNLSNE